MKNVIAAALKIDARTNDWKNAVAFIQSVYGTKVTEYDFDKANNTLAKLSAEEYHALVEWILKIEDTKSKP